MTVTVKLCPGHKGATPCSDGGARAIRPCGGARSHCAKHFAFLGRESKLLKNIQQYFEASGVDLSDKAFVDRLTNPPSRKILARPIRPRAEAPAVKELQEQVARLQHKVEDTRLDYERAKREKQQAACA